METDDLISLPTSLSQVIVDEAMGEEEEGVEIVGVTAEVAATDR